MFSNKKPYEFVWHMREFYDFIPYIASLQTFQSMPHFMPHLLSQSLVLLAFSGIFMPHLYAGTYQNMDFASDQDRRDLQKEMDDLNEKVRTLQSKIQAWHAQKTHTTRDEMAPESGENSGPVLIQSENADCDEDEMEEESKAPPRSHEYTPKLLSVDAVIANIPKGWVVGTYQESAPPAQPPAAQPASGPSAARPAAPAETPAPSAHTSPEFTPSHRGGAVSLPLKRAKFLLKNKKFKKARTTFEHLTENPENPAYPFALYWLGILNLHEHHLDAAISCFKKTYLHCSASTHLDHQKLCVSALLRLTTALLRSKKKDQAESIFQQCQKQADPIRQHLSQPIQKNLQETQIFFGHSAEPAPTRPAPSITNPAKERRVTGDTITQPAKIMPNTGMPTDNSEDTDDDNAQEQDNPQNLAFSDTQAGA